MTLNFIETLNALDILNENYRSQYLNLTDNEKKAASLAFWAAIKAKTIDLENFHKAFDADLDRLNLMNIFDDNGFIYRHGWGNLKKADPNEFAVKAAKKYWGLRFADRIKPQQEIDIDKQKELEDQQKEAERQALEAQKKAEEEQQAQEYSDLINNNININLWDEAADYDILNTDTPNCSIDLKTNKVTFGGWILTISKNSAPEVIAEDINHILEKKIDQEKEAIKKEAEQLKRNNLRKKHATYAQVKDFIFNNKQYNRSLIYINTKRSIFIESFKENSNNGTITNLDTNTVIDELPEDAVLVATKVLIRSYQAQNTRQDSWVDYSYSIASKAPIQVYELLEIPKPVPDDLITLGTLMRPIQIKKINSLSNLISKDTYFNNSKLIDTWVSVRFISTATD